MEYTEIIQAFIKIIEDSFNQKNKICKINQYDIYIKLKDLTEQIQERHVLGWIDYLKYKKPGYVIEDLRVILKLGFGEVFGPAVHYDREVLQDWAYQYGQKWISKEVQSSKRNMYLGEAAKAKKRQLLHQEYDPKYTSLAEMKEKYGAEYMKKYFPNIIALLRGDIEIGCPVEDIPITNHPDPMLEDL